MEQEASGGAPGELLLRPWRDADTDGLRAAIDEDVDHLKPWLGWTLEEPASPERTAARLRGWIWEHGVGRARRYALVPAAEPGRILGGANLYVSPAERGVGYWVRRSAAGRGMAGAAVAALVVDAFRAPDVARVVLTCDVANTGSAGFARHLGFTDAGAVDGTHRDGTPRPLLAFEMPRIAYVDVHAAALGRRALRVRIVEEEDGV